MDVADGQLELAAAALRLEADNQELAAAGLQVAVAAGQLELAEIAGLRLDEADG